MLILGGAPAFSPARMGKRLAAIRAGNPEVTDAAAEHVHLVDADGEPTAAERAVLDRLLTYGPTRPRRELHGLRLWVVPRLGTISPWASKATDIARICGLQRVRRIERGVAWTLAGRVTDPAAL